MLNFLKIFTPLVFLSLLSFNANAREVVTSEHAFEQMKTLVGTWKKENDKKGKFRVSFELTANNTVLVETWLRGSKKHSLTVYHQDGERLLATHYCPQGNQPRLRLTMGSKLNKLSFNYLDSTNLASLKDSHQHSLEFEFSEQPNSIRRGESYLSGAGENHSEMTLVRLPNKTGD